ncbi:MAG TPA: DUF2272 domain-containing protein [Pseudolabrys sp.]|jgi:hypothetical protein|nr:DUF2272 domain-containing protein [Pseudolabrys sp.]
MRATVCIIVAAIGLAAHPALAQPDRTAATFWTSVQANCDATAAKPASELGRRIAQTAIEEFDSFGGHRIDANGRLVHFGLTEAENEPEGARRGTQASLGRLGWWRVLAYWRSLYGGDIDSINDQLEVRGYHGASTSKDAAQTAARLPIDFGPLLRAADSVSDPDMREALREAVIRSALIDTSWSAAFISYVIRQAGVAESGFQFANAHRVYIYDAFATSAAELVHGSDAHIYRACPLATTRPRVGDLICDQREPALADDSDAAVRERIRGELTGSPGARTVRHTHCEVVAHIDAAAHKMVTIGGNVLNGVAARKLNLRRGLTVSPVQKGRCGGAGGWTLPGSAADMPQSQGKCSLNDQKWFVLLQLR